jgi:hypothetical protein
LTNAFRPERQQGESFEDYKQRRRVLNAIRVARQNQERHGPLPGSAAFTEFKQRGNPQRRLYKRAKASKQRKQHQHPLRDANGAYTLVGRNPRRMWLAGVSSRLGF